MTLASDSQRPTSYLYYNPGDLSGPPASMGVWGWQKGAPSPSEDIDVLKVAVPVAAAVEPVLLACEWVGALLEPPVNMMLFKVVSCERGSDGKK